MSLSPNPQARANQLANLRPVSRDPEKAREMGKLDGFGSGKHAQCEKVLKNGARCKRAACFGTPKCRQHGARRYKAAPASPASTVAWFAAFSRLGELRRAGLIPVELERSKHWPGGKQYPRMVALVEAWQAAQQGNPEPWQHLTRN